MGLLTVLTVKKIEFPKSKMADGRPFEKTVKSSYISKRWIDFDEIWHGGANWQPTGDRPFAKFGMIMQISPFRGETVKISKF